MPTSTTYAQLYLYNNTTDKESLFSEFRERIAGTAETSNMQKIDKLFSQDNDRISKLEDSAPILTAKATTSDSGNNFVVTIEGFTEYKQDMIMVIYLSQNNVGLTTININNIGTKSLMKIGENGTATNLEANDLKKNVGYLFQYDGTQFILLQEKTFESLDKEYLGFESLEPDASPLVSSDSVQPYANGKPAAINTFTKYIYELTPENELGERLDNKISDIDTALSGKANSSQYLNKTLSANGWIASGSIFVQDIEIEGLTAEQNGIIGVSHNVSEEQLEAVRGAGMFVKQQSSGILTIALDGEVPVCDIPVVIILLG